jgi:serine/threonine protein kinase
VALSPGAQLGPYEIVAPIGAGGMGEVYRARDTRLERIVALKVLPAHLAGDPALRERFEREAKAISQLNHPNICTLHDVGSEQGIDFLVMEHLEGETLGERIARGALPVAASLHVARQIAEGLDRAHSAGIIHRDLKPSNIFLVRGGGSAAPIVKLLDFGLAKSVATLISQNTASPTLAQALTGHGTILGTLQYMAPEQLEGRDVDVRADVFAFGAVLYEMLTGKRAFDGRSQASVIASILSADPPAVSSLQPVTPAALDHLVGRALAKEPAERWASMHDVLLQLRWIATLPAPPASPQHAPPATSRERLGWMSAVAALVAALAAATLWPRTTPPAPSRLHFEIPPPPETTFLASGFATIYMTPTLSNDGTSMIVPALGADGIRRLWLRRIDAVEPQLLSGTENGFLPFWSPDDRSIGFFSERTLRRLDLSGGTSRALSDAPSGLGGTWNEDGVIVFAPRTDGPLHRIPAAGGVAAPVTALAASKHSSHRFPDFLPDGRHFLFLARSANADEGAILVGSLDSTETSPVMASQLQAVFIPPRWIGYQGTSIGGGGTLVAPLLVQAFDPATRQISGEPITLQPNVVVSVAGNGAYSFSNQDTLAFRVPSANRSETLNWHDRNGTLESTIGGPGDLTVPRLSPDGRRLALATGGAIWVRDLSRGTVSRLTSGPADCCAVWSPDGTRIAFRNGTQNIAVVPATGTAAVSTVLANGAANTPTQWTPDGRGILFQAIGANRIDTYLVPLTDPRTPTPVLQSAFSEEQAQLSPDGRWIAFTSDESGRPEVYVQDYPALQEKVLVSTSGGADPQWRRDGGELYFIAADHKLMSVAIARGAKFAPGIPTPLFQTRVTGLTDVRTHYQAAADGKRFLVVTIGPGDRGAPIQVIANWQTRLMR